MAAPMLVTNAGTVLSGRVDEPRLDADTVLVVDGRIAAVGRAGSVDVPDGATVIDVGGATVAPGLHDDHVHPVLGDWTPRQRTVDFIDSSLHGGVTTMVSAGEPHTPGRPTDPAGVKALAILAHRSFTNARPSGVKVHAGAVLLEPGLTEDDFEEMAAAGVRLVGEIGISGVKDPDVAAEMTRWAQARGMRVMVHTGGASIPGSGVIGADFVVAVRPDVAGHVNGGPTALPLADVERILDETDARIELVHNGNVTMIGRIAELARERGELGRVVVGTDSPAGSGVQPLGILRVMASIASLGGVDGAVAVATATGTTAELHGLDTGVLEVGRAGDLVVLDAPLGSSASDAVGALEIGDTPAVAVVLIDGELRVTKSRNTPPAMRTVNVTLGDGR
jgi:enamidase